MLAVALAVATVPIAAILSWRVLNPKIQTLSDSSFDVRLGFAHPPSWFERVRRSALNNGNVDFVLANAPAAVLSSFGAQQQNIARLSLNWASAMLVRRLRDENLLWAGFRQTLRSCVLKLLNIALLVACCFGRMLLTLLRGLGMAIPQTFKIWTSATILSKIGMLILIADDDYSDVDDQQDELVSGSTQRSLAAALETAVADISRALHCSLPNDLSCLIFLATIRDNNTGTYIHPEIAKRFSQAIADQAMLACHRQVFERVVALSLEDLTDQLDAYMKTVTAPRRRLIESWTKLRAYRSTIPMDADPVLSEIYFMKVEVAVAVLEARLPNLIH